MEEILFFNRYQIEMQLGSGAMGIIYRAHDLVLDRPVALKIVSNATLGQTGKDRLLAEAQAAAKLNHSNIVSIFDAGEYDQKPFIVMELVEGESLFDRKPEGWKEIITAASQICSALTHAHEHGVVHRDLKPENIIRDSKGVIKLTDFGLARSVASRLSSEGSIIGTVYYIAPETVQGKPIDGRADLYGLGVMLYEWSTGILPFTAEDPVAIISQHLFSPVIPPHVHNPEIPAALEVLILSLLGKTPEERPASATEVLEMLGRIDLQGKQGSGQQQGYLERLAGVARGRLVAREKELDEMTSIWHRAAGGESQVLLVSGEPGIGKTRICRELGVRAALSNATVLLGECYAEGGMPFYPFLAMLRETLSNQNLYGSLNLPDYILADLMRIVPGLDAQFPAVKPNPTLEPEVEQQRIFEAVVAWVISLSQRKPLFIFLDDIHWADSGTLFLMRHLARRIRNQRVMLTATYREIELDEAAPLQSILFDLTRERLAQRIKLTRLNLEQTAGMLGALLNPAGRVDTGLVEAIFLETEGNPFFIEEVIKSLLEENRMQLLDGLWQAQDLEHVNIPQSIRITIQSRLAHLSEATQEALRLAAVFGREFDFALLLTASELPEDTLVDILEQAEKAQIIREVPKKRSTDGMVFAFAHALMPTTLRENLSGLRRQRLHRKAAGAIQLIHPQDFETLAYHYEEAGDAEKALDNYTAAADRAMSLFAYPEAERYYREAIEVCPTCALYNELLSKLGEVYFRQSRYQDAIQTWQKCIEAEFAEKNMDKVAQLYARSARSAWYIHPSKGLEICKEGLAKIPGDLVGAGMAALLHEIARAYRFNEQPEDALPLARRALAMAENLSLVDVQADTLATIGILPNVESDEALVALEKSASLADDAGFLAVSGRAHLNLGAHLIQRGRFRDAAAHIEQSREVDHKLGIPTWEHTALGALANVYLTLGDLAQADRVIRHMDRLLLSIADNFRPRMFTRLFNAIWLFNKGEITSAGEMISTAIEEIRKQGDLSYLTTFLNNATEILIQQAKFDQALEMINESNRIIALDAEPDIVSIHYEKAWVFILQGKLTEARSEMEVLKQIHHPEFPLIIPIHINLLEARLAIKENRLDDAIDCFVKVREQIQKLEWRWRLAEGNIEMAEAYMLRAKKLDHEKAAYLLNEAIMIFQDLDTPYYLQKSQTILDSLKGRQKNG